MNKKTEIIETELTNKFKGKYLDAGKLKNEVEKMTKRYFLPAGYDAKAIIDPYGGRVIRVEVVRV